MRRRPTLTCFVLVAATLLLTVLALAVVIFFPDLFTGELRPTAITVTATRQVSPPALPGLNQLTLDPSGRYAFPIAAETAYFTWTYTNRSFPNAVIFEARAGLTRDEYEQVMRAPVVAVVEGTVRIANNARDGLAYLLLGDDGSDYLYAHLGEQWLADGVRVNRGQALGLPGNSGVARYQERQVRFAVGPRDSLAGDAPPINAAEWINAIFGLHWAERAAEQAPASWPSGYPVFHERFIVVTPYSHSTDRGLLPEPALEFGFTGIPPSGPQNVYATLDGTVNVMRWTDPYGTRIQITNEAAAFTVIISGLDTWWVEDGQVVSKGALIGQWDPANRPRLHYMIFQVGVNIDPESTLR